MNAQKRGRGRPPVEGPTAEEQIHIRVRKDDKARYERKAAGVGQTLSAWIKKVLDRASR
jgi:predicted HicB family RNase H-like nuclease